ncbi:hypothetical protein MTR67_016936 [Solanum verrucosum]|uniref:Uncharacterized protein n=1 Tax=Solanum verrucosum TaxID=315347 RepID=A0AAF0QHS1_SOLVR|nr:hypothetical protein MTR67_016936 [Solanum verrucosum]
MSRLTKLEVFKYYGSPYLEDPLKSFVLPTSFKRLTLTMSHYFVWAYLSSIVMMLPNLEQLKLKHCRTFNDEWRRSVEFSLSDEFRLSDGHKFKSMKLLLLSGLALKHWEASSDNFPNLKCLVLKKCNRLQEIPVGFGEIGTLESIELHDCSITAEDSTRELEQEQEDMWNYFLKVYIHNSRSTF